jgi:hypothetical protein
MKSSTFDLGLSLFTLSGLNICYHITSFRQRDQSLLSDRWANCDGGLKIIIFTILHEDKLVKMTVPFIYVGLIAVGIECLCVCLFMKPNGPCTCKWGNGG